MQQALQRTRAEDKGDRAWILTHLGRLLAKKKDYANAEMALNAALELFPNYHYALANLAEIRKEQKNFAAAAELYRKRYESAPHPENLYDLGDALAKAGKQEEARAAFVKFEASALAESTKMDNANRELALYYLDHAKKPVEGLRIAELEASRRRDVHTLEVYAKALRSNGKIKAAKDALDEAEQRLNASLRKPVTATAKSGI
jgi:tetratricopeptide (TPR) repeat protein